MKQGSPEWFDARRMVLPDGRTVGRLTGSVFAAALGLSKYKSRQELWRQLTGKKPNDGTNPAMEWGTANEQNAVNFYQCETGNLVRRVGFIPHPRHDFLGVSPDGLVDDDGIIEAKCPATLRLYDGIPDHYLPQVLGVIHITMRRWGDFICWTPAEGRIVRVEADADKWATWEQELVAFWNDYVLKDTEPPRKGKKHGNHSEMV